MLSLFSRNMCCSIRDKDGKAARFGLGADMANFIVNEVEVPMESPCLMAFAPLWQSNVVCIRRLALANEQMVNVYNLSSTFGDDCFSNTQSPSSSVGKLNPEQSLTVEEGQSITSVLFRDEDSSRHLLVAFGPTVAAGAKPPSGKYLVRVWSCEADPAASPDKGAISWRQNEGYLASLEEHCAPVTRMAVSSTYLLTVDSSGECRVWQKTRNFQPRAVARLHQGGGVSDLAVDRLFAYSVGGQDLAIRVWSMPDLKQVLTISADAVECQPIPVSMPGTEVASVAPCPCRFSQLTAVRRPTSRWSGAQASTRNSGTPRGMLFVAGTIAETAEGPAAACAGAGVLMEWALGVTPFCQSAQVAHESKIVALAYGPYDNGPLVTADAWGVFRIWDYTPRLWCSQQLITGELMSPTNVAISVDPLQRALYSIVGDKRLCVWRQNGLNSDMAA